jgi:polyribonucleotide nucleotidyltransferase
VTGTKDGITACQMDIKIKDLKREILEKALHQAKEGRLHIMEQMEKTISEPRPQVKDFVPKMVKIEIDKEYIGAVIGKGGKDIQQLQEDTDTTIVIEEVDGKGVIEIMGTDMDKIQKVLDRIDIITFEPTVGEIYEGRVTSIKDFGAFIEIAPGTEGLLHISEIDWKRVENVSDELKEGDIVKVKLLGMDRGKMKLSRKVLLPRPPRKDKKEDQK